MRLPKLANGFCSECGSEDITLCEDTVETRYTDVKFKDGEWTRARDSRLEIDTGTTIDPVRLFCTTCGTYHKVPEELET